MEKTILVTYPESLANALKLGEKDFEKEIKIISLIKLYELGKIFSAKAAKILEMDRVSFLEKLGEYKVSIFGYQDEDDLQQDIANA